MATAIGDLVVRLNGQSRQFDQTMQRARGVLGTVGDSATAMGAKFGAAFAAIQAGVGVLRRAVDAMSGMVSTSVRLAAEMETTNVSFKVLLGSAEAATKVLGDLKDFAASTPFEFPELADATRMLIAFGVSQDDLIPTLRRIGDISSGLSIPIGELAELYGKARVQGRLFAQDVNQLTGRGIPVIAEFAKQFGKAEKDVRKLVESGKIGFSNLERAFIDLTAEGGKFSGLMAAQSETLSGLWSTLTDTISAKLRALGELIVDTFHLKEAIKGVIAFVENFNNSMAAVASVTAAVAANFVAAWAGAAAAFVAFVDQMKSAIFSLADTAEKVASGIAGIFFELQRSGLSATGESLARAFQIGVGVAEKVQAARGPREAPRDPIEAFKSAFEIALKAAALDFGEKAAAIFPAAAEKAAAAATETATTAVPELADDKRKKLFAGAADVRTAEGFSAINKAILAKGGKDDTKLLSSIDATLKRIEDDDGEVIDLPPA